MPTVPHGAQVWSPEKLVLSLNVAFMRKEAGANKEVAALGRQEKG